MIISLFIAVFFLVSLFGLTEPEYVTITTQRFSYLPYEFSIQIPDNYKEIECYIMSGQPMELHVILPDGGYVYLSKQKYIPNTGRIRSMGNDAYNQRFGFLTGKPCDIYNPNGDELVLLNNEGKDTKGLYWRDVHYIFPDSICYVSRRGKLIQVPKDRRFRLSLGYSNVPYEDKEIFDKIIGSMKIRPVDMAKRMTCLVDTTWINVNTTNPRIRRLCVMPSVDEIQKQ